MLWNILFNNLVRKGIQVPAIFKISFDMLSRPAALPTERLLRTCDISDGAMGNSIGSSRTASLGGRS